MKRRCSEPPTLAPPSEAVVRSGQETNPDTLDARSRLIARNKRLPGALERGL